MAANAIELLCRMAHNNEWANARLHRAVSALDAAAYRQTRTSFFPSIHLTLTHILFVDRYYVNALTLQSGSAAELWAELKRWEQEKGFAEVSAAQREIDQRLTRFVQELQMPEDLDVQVRLERRDHFQIEPRANVLLHLFQHQIHHRGQVHAMLSGTLLKPPQLDDFFLQGDLALRAAELQELNLPIR